MLKVNKLRKSYIRGLIIAFILIFSFSNVFALDGVWHKPYGYENFYGSNEISPEPCERYPRDPAAGETVLIKCSTWPQEMGQTTWVTWTKNGVNQTPIGGQWQYNSGNNTYWQITLGSFSKGDVINYTVHADVNGGSEKTIGSFSFTVVDWDWVTSVSSYNDYSDRVQLNCSSNSGTFSPVVNIFFPETDYFGLEFSPDGTGATTTGAASYTLTNYSTYILISTADMKVKVIKNPYKLEVYKSDGTTLITEEYDRTNSRSLAWMTDGTTNGTYSVTKLEENLYTPSTEKFYGFGQRYNDLDKRGDDVDIYAVNWYKDQNEKAYLPVPMYLNSNKYAFYLDSTYYSQFRIASDVSDKCTIRANAGGNTGKVMKYYLFTGADYKTLLGDYADVTGKPALVPVWALGPWISANEWNTQTELQDQIDATNNNNIPTSAIVLEAWSDEETYYVWGGATYTPSTGGGRLTSSDFTYGGNWPDPATLIDNAHDSNIKILLWQIPCMKYLNPAPTQMANDEAYAIAQNYLVKNADGTPYRLPPVWFGSSLTPDFTSASATSWWMSKRQYLFDDLNIDGFKCDGGEFIWGRGLQFSNGKKGDEMRNAYPDYYIQAYYDYSKTKNSDSVAFSRTGGSKAQLHPIVWAGDQNSSWSAYQDAVRSSISASMSGIPFVTWDLAGFSDDIPATDLYKRSVTQAAFSPIMQLHSEQSNPSPSRARTPWNMYSRTSDVDCLNIYREFANIRMSLLPYLYTEAKYTSDNAVPMMRHMAIEFPDDTTAPAQTFQYMLGGSLLVAPIVDDETTTKSVYLPDAEWIDFFWHAQRPGSATISYGAGLDAIPVFAKAGSIIPMNMNSTYDLGGTIGNDVSTYDTLTFRMYPYGSTSYSWYDYVNSTARTIDCEEEYDSNTVTITLPAIPVTSTLQVFTTEPTSVTAGGTTLTEYNTQANLEGAATGWYYDTAKLLTFVKVGSSASSRSIVLNGVNKASYEAEFATLSGTAVNTNHTGYLGTGFVDGFSDQGDYLDFDVWSKSAGTYTVDFRYSAGAAAAQRSIYVNSSHVSNLAMSQTANWDTWGTSSLSVTLNAGKNTIRIAYDAGDYTGINVDGLVLHQ